MVNFFWRFCSNVFPTAVALQSRRVNSSSCCSRCHVGAEDAVHLLFDCSIARDVWCSTGLQDVVRVMNNDTVMKVLKRVINEGIREKFVIVGLMVEKK